MTQWLIEEAAFEGLLAYEFYERSEQRAQDDAASFLARRHEEMRAVRERMGAG